MDSTKQKLQYSAI